MPALVLYGHKFHMASDDVPLFALFGAVFHALMIIVMLITSQSIMHMPDICHHAGRQYIATVTGLLVCFTCGLVLEVLLIIEGSRGGPFELSKRRRMPLLLTLRFGNLILETAMSAYGTYVVFGTHVRCKIREDMYWNPKKEVKVLVILTWVFQVLVLLNAYVWYNAWPDHTKAHSWDSRFRWIGKWILCQPAPSSESKQDSLRKITRWLAKLIGHLDLTPSDFGLALIMVATLQRKRRRERIKKGIQEALTIKQAESAGQAPAMTVSLLQAPSLLLPLDDAISGPITSTEATQEQLRQHIEQEVVPVLSLLDSDQMAASAEQLVSASHASPSGAPAEPGDSAQESHAASFSPSSEQQQQQQQRQDQNAQSLAESSQQKGHQPQAQPPRHAGHEPVHRPGRQQQPRLHPQQQQIQGASMAAPAAADTAAQLERYDSVQHLRRVRQGETQQSVEADMLGGLLRMPSRTFSQRLSFSAAPPSDGRPAPQRAQRQASSRMRSLRQAAPSLDSADPDVEAQTAATAARFQPSSNSGAAQSGETPPSASSPDHVSEAAEDAQRRQSGGQATTSQAAAHLNLEAGRTQKEADTGAASMVGGPLLKFKRQMSLLRNSCITPSGMEEELRAGLGAEKAVQAYTGHHWKIPAAQLAEIDHFAKYAVAVYGVEAPVENRSSRWKRAWQAYWAKHREEPFGGDEEDSGSLLDKLNYEAILQEAEIEETDLLYLSYHNEAMAHLPYLIALDSVSRSVLLAIRGTATMEDVITDSVAEPEALTDDWLPEAFRAANKAANERMYAHAGIVAASRAILTDLDLHGVLPALLHGEYERGDELVKAIEAAASKDQEARGKFVAAVMQRRLDCKGWKLVVTGHSLGAGAAALITLRLRDRFPEAQCWAFCPPGGLMSVNLSRAVEPFVRSVVVGKDIVPRTSFVNLARLLDEVVTSLALCKHNKADMLLRRMGPFWRHRRVDQLCWPYEEVPEEALRVLEAYAESIEARNRMMELIPPGRVVFLRPHKVGGVRTFWDGVWLKAEEIIKEGILVSPRMIDDHYTSTLQEALRSAQHRTGDSADGPSYFPPVPVDEDTGTSCMPSILVQP